MTIIIPVIAAMIITESYFIWQESLNQFWNYGYSGSFGDCLMFIFKGIREFNPEIDNEFIVPVAYLTINIIIAIFISGHAVKDLRGYGMKKLIRYGSRLRWWKTGCVWNVLCVLKYYMCFYIGVALMCIIHFKDMDAGSPIAIHEDIINSVFEGEAEGAIQTWLLLVMIIVLPIFTTMAMSMLQMALEFFVLPSVSFICIMAVYILSVFYMSPFMPGNYMMVYRMNQINPAGVGLMQGVLIDMAIIIVSIVVGYAGLKKRDII